MKKIFLLFMFCFLAAWHDGAAQTFEVNGQAADEAAKKSSAAKPGAPDRGIGWGSSIEVGRLTRAAEQELARGNSAAATDYVARAVKAAPQNTRLWFLLGYTARLAGRYGQSVDAYEHGLRAEPNSVEGLSGLAQTYMRTGRTEQAKRILLEVIAANPRRAAEQAMVGELYLQAGDARAAVEMLVRAEAMKPEAHTELLLASAYMKMKQPQQARQMLERARARGNSPDVARATANYYREQGDCAAAVKILSELPPKSAAVWGELGYTQGLAGDKRGAAASYTRAAEAAPGDVRMQLSAAAALVQNDDEDKARVYLARAEKIDANHYRLHAIRADLARRKKALPEAIAEYGRALAVLPAGGVPEGVLYPIQLRLNLAEMYRDAGEQEPAEREIKQAEESVAQLDIQGPARAEFLRMRASINNAAGRYDAAESDLKQALEIDPENINTVVQYAALLWRMKRPDEARKLYDGVLRREANNRLALESLGYLARETGDNKTAEQFFNRLRDAYPNEYGAYLALGDLYTAERRLGEAQRVYEQAYRLDQNNAQVISGGANAAIEARQLELAASWLERARGRLTDDARVMRERERYLFHRGKYLESAELGWKVIAAMPKDREGSVYLAYDLYNLGRYDEALALARRYQQVLPKEPNFPLIAGHAEKQAQLLGRAVDDYTRALEIDPKLDQAWINRGYVLNDLQNAEQAASDFRQVLKTQSDNGVARLGLAFSLLQLRQGKQALEEAAAAERLLGESGSTHLASAGAYRLMRLLPEAEREYRAALKFSPDDPALHLALADTLYNLHRYAQSIEALKQALALAPNEASIYGKLAHASARLHNREMTLRYVETAERLRPDSSPVLLDTGDALLTLGDRAAANQRFARALDAPDANRVEARLLIAKEMVASERWNDARQQISLALAEARIGEAAPVTVDNLIAAANLFQAMHDFDLAEQYLMKAREAGAADEVVAIALANNHLARGNTAGAQTELAALGSPTEMENNYDYTLAMGNIYRQRRQTLPALTAFARANQLGGEEDVTQKGMEQLAGEEGYRITDKLSLATDLTFAGIFDDATIYQSYARLNRLVGAGATGSLASLPPHSLEETRWLTGYRYHQSGLPLISGFFEMRNARGSYAVPSSFQFLRVDTYDTIVNGGLNPVARIGRNSIYFNTSLSYTARRDRQSPVQLNQNLFRQSVYAQTNPLWNWLTVRGSAMHEGGGFTAQRLSSRDWNASLEFEVGRPWGRLAMITGYRMRDLRFSPRALEWYQTASYAGLERKFGRKLQVAGLANYLRGWAVNGLLWGNGGALRPAFRADYQPNRRWDVNGEFAWSSGRGFHAYDNMQSRFFISYQMPLRRTMNDGAGEVSVSYPLRFSVGIEQQSFTNFAGPGASQWRPSFRITVF